jgi:hypothetical protein
MIAEAWKVLEESFTIVAFVALTLLIIEYFNVVSQGAWMRRLTSGKLAQYVLCGALGAMPGCVGGFAVVSLYSHRRVSLGAVIACMIAACGDEAFVMLALFPGRAAAMLCGLFALGVAVGAAVDVVGDRLSKARPEGDGADCDFHTHGHETADASSLRGRFREQWKKPSAIRAILTCAIACFVLFLVANQFHLLGGHGGEAAHGGEAEGGVDFEWVSLVVFSLVGIFIVATVSDHFLEEHLWHHVLRTHVPRIFLWTVGALGAIAALQHFVDLGALIAGNRYAILLVAVAVGCIPQSGPHLIFTTLYAAGALPFGILVANSVVQDGHGMLPMLAHSRRHFLIIKAIDGAVALAVGAAMLAFGM